VEAIDAKMVQLQNRIDDSELTIPVNGIVLHKIAEPFEYTAPGKPLFKIANISELNLRVYLPQAQMSQIKLGQKVTIKVDGLDGEMLDFPGTISWIASEAEFTPKTIQTKETRVDLVYAVKIRVKNDGALKIGMPAELWLQ
jgi:HlyD family secretion protein